MFQPIASLPASSWSEINEIILSVKPQRCQAYVAAVLEELESKGYIEHGDVVRAMREAVEPSMYEAVMEEPSAGETSIYDLYMYALGESMGGLKKDKCCY